MTRNEEMANLLNKCFGEVFTREDIPNVTEPEHMEMEGILEDLHITVAGVKRKIRGLRKDAAPGPDGIGPRVLILLRELLD